ncbi:thioredoxin [bacterium]|nr:thioredoxin [bacterium]
MKKLHTLPALIVTAAVLLPLSVHLACTQEEKAPAETRKSPIVSRTDVQEQQQASAAADKKYVRSLSGTNVFDAAIAAAGDTLVMVDLYADWCAPCRALAPVLEEVAKEKNNRVLVFKVNVDDNRPLAQRYQVRSIPYVVFIKNGEMVQSLLGLRPKSAYIEVIDSLAPVSGD